MAFIAPALPYIAAGAALGGSVLGAVGQSQAGTAQQAAYNANARAMQLKAQTDQDAAEAEARQIELANQRRYGTIRTDYAAAGVDVNTGSPLEVMADQHMQGALQAKLQRYQGKVQAAQDLASADISYAQGSAARSAGNLGAGATLLTGIGRAASPFLPVPRIGG